MQCLKAWNFRYGVLSDISWGKRVKKGGNTAWLHLGKCSLAGTHGWSLCSCFQLTDGSFQSSLRLKTNHPHLSPCSWQPSSHLLRGPATWMEMRVRKMFFWGKQQQQQQHPKPKHVLTFWKPHVAHAAIPPRNHSTTPRQSLSVCYCTHVSHCSQSYCTFWGEEMQVSCQNYLCTEKWREELEWFEDNLEEGHLQLCFSITVFLS